MSKRASRPATFEYRNGDNIEACTAAITGTTAGTTATLSMEHVTLHRGVNRIAADAITDAINPRLSRWQRIQ